MGEAVSDYNKNYYSTTHETPIGKVTIAIDAVNVVGIWLEGQNHFGGPIKDKLIDGEEFELFDRVKDWLDRYFAGKKPEISELPLAPIGTDFRIAVWNTVKQIPYGKVTTYYDISKKVAKEGREEKSYRAVGVAVGNNPLLIVVPCHRVIGKGASMTFYSAGAENKLKLLEHENADLSIVYYPIPGKTKLEIRKKRTTKTYPYK